MKPAVARMLIAVLGSLLCEAALAQAGPAPAQSNAYRDKRWEFTIQMRGLEGKTHTFDGGSTADTKDTLGWGFGVSYNVNPHLNLGGEFFWASQDYTSTIQPAAGSGSSAYTGRGNVDIASFMFNATWHFVQGPVTPYVAAGIGSTTVDTNIPSGPPVNSCWYYPWYGYYCGVYTPTATQTAFSYNAGAGIRWDFSREMFMRVGVQRQYTDFSGASESYPGMNVWRLELGFKN